MRPHPKLEPHPHALLFPLIEGDAFLSLVDDIRENGLCEAITLFDGKILDGRNRYRAMLEIDHEFSLANAPKMFVNFEGDDPLEWVLSKNLHRRHLNESQRAVVAAKMMDAAPKANQYTRGISLTVASRRMNISARTVSRARDLMKREPSIVAQIENGARKVGEEPDRRTVSVVLTDAEHARVTEAARLHNVAVSTWIRDVLLREIDSG